MLSAVHRKGSLHSDAERVAAVTSWLVLGSVRRVSEATGIPVRTLQEWQHTEWWAPLIAQVRAERGAELDASLSRIIDLAMAAVADRLQHGDAVVTKDGSIIRKPISGRDAAVILGIAADKRQLLRVAEVIEHAPDNNLPRLAGRLVALLGGVRDRVLEHRAEDFPQEDEPK